jgi:hypothetical protein
MPRCPNCRTEHFTPTELKTHLQRLISTRNDELTLVASQLTTGWKSPGSGPIYAPDGSLLIPRDIPLHSVYYANLTERAFGPSLHRSVYDHFDEDVHRLGRALGMSVFVQYRLGRATVFFYPRSVLRAHSP